MILIESGTQYSPTFSSSRVETVDSGDEAATWLSDFLGQPCRLIRQSPDSIRGGQKRLNTGKTTKSLSKAWCQIHYILSFDLVLLTNGFVLIKRTDVKSVVAHFIPFL